MTIAMRAETPASDLVPVQNSAVERIIDWAGAADAAYQMAQKLANTSFVPAKYRGKPAEMAAAFLAGAELGLDPMASMRAFHDIQGTPRPAAETLRAVVQSHGHDIRLVEASDTRVVMKGRRKEHVGDESAWQFSEWDMPRAVKAGFPKKNPNWGTQPKAMLIARATSEVCKLVANDAIMGMASAEEAQDMGAEPGYMPAPSRVTGAEILGGGVPDVDEPVRATAEVGDALPKSAPPADAEPMTKAQQGKMFALFAERGLNSPAQQRDFVAEKIGRQIASRNDLTKDEAKVVIDALEALPMPAAEATPDVDMGGAELEDPIEGELQ
ncbi:hypothetical protein ABT369_28310 [Dactylosporangium sp. NPDC000244]|uniref:hypothetical protein n=1 Tax=Dactylosporangium sp. NPDC000244 TaxID=3154365 RepID=UPI00332A5494